MEKVEVAIKRGRRTEGEVDSDRQTYNNLSA